MMTISLSVIVAIKVVANEINWERRWTSGTVGDHSDDLDAEHSSLTDISHAVATTPERVADIIPGILLILGLLGTFVGLGVALNKASIILTEASSADIGDSLSNLISMMSGLGTKFKTSTWGILSFLLFKTWASYNDFDERRLRWCIQKVKRELATVRTHKEEKEATQNQKILYFLEKIEEGINSSRISAKENSTYAYEMKVAIIKYIKENQKYIDSFSSATHDIAESASSMGISARDLRESINQFDNEVKNVLGGVRKDIENSINRMSNEFTKNLISINECFSDASNNLASTLGAAAEGISHSSEKINTSIYSLSQELTAIMEKFKYEMIGAVSNIDKSIEKQLDAYKEFQITSESLTDSVNIINNIVEDLGITIKSALDAVSDSRLEKKEELRRFVEAFNALQSQNKIIEKMLSNTLPNSNASQ